VGDPGLRALFTARARRQRYLDVEAALALAQVECGLIPVEAGAAIEAAAHLELLDEQSLDAGQARTGHVMMPVVTELSRVVGAAYGGWVHWGATTQNIQQTADVLGMRRAVEIIIDYLRGVVSRLADLADEHADTVMAGRTHGQQAVPITFGFKVAAWLDTMLRHLERLDQIGDRLFIAMAGGAAGTFAAMGPQGPQVQDRFAQRLGLHSMPVPSRSIADPFAELVCTLALLSATTSTIAEEISRLAAVEFGELAESVPPGDVGSSTMPQKRNSKLCQEVTTVGAQIRALVPLALEALIHAHEVDGSRTAMMDEAVEQTLILSADALVRTEDILNQLQVFPQRMRHNLDLSGGAIMAEAVMMTLAQSVGRQQAHEIVHQAAQLATATNRPFSEVLAHDTEIAERLSTEQRNRLLDPSSHTGSSAEIARTTARRAHHRLGTAESHPAQP